MENRAFLNPCWRRALLKSTALLLLWLAIAASFGGYGYYLAPGGYGQNDKIEGLVGFLGLGVAVGTLLTGGLWTLSRVTRGRTTRFSALLYLALWSLLSVILTPCVIRVGTAVSPVPIFGGQHRSGIIIVERRAVECALATLVLFGLTILLVRRSHADGSHESGNPNQAKTTPR